MAAKAISRGGKAVSVGGKWLATNAAGESPRCCCCCPDPPDSLCLTLTGPETHTLQLERDDTDLPEGCTQQWIRDVASTCDSDCDDELFIRCCGGKYWLYVNEDDPIELTTVACDPFELTVTATFVICEQSSAEYDASIVEGPCECGCCPDPPVSIVLTARLGESLFTFILERDDTDIPEGCEQQWLQVVCATDSGCTETVAIRCCDGVYYLYVGEEEGIALTSDCSPFYLYGAGTATICEATTEFEFEVYEGECATCADACCGSGSMPTTLSAEIISGTGDAACLVGETWTMTGGGSLGTPPSYCRQYQNPDDPILGADTACDPGLAVYDEMFANLLCTPAGWFALFTGQNGFELGPDDPSGVGISTLSGLTIHSCSPFHATAVFDLGTATPLPHHFPSGSITVEYTE